MKRLDRFLNSNWPSIIVVVILLIIALAVIAGCSATRAIGNTAVKVQQNARIASTSIAEAVSTGEVGPKAAPHLEVAAAAVNEIEADAVSIVEVINSGAVKDAESPFWTWVKRFWWLCFLIAAIVLSVIYAPVIRPVLLVIGAWLHIIPKPIRLQATTAAEFIADTSPADNTDVNRIREIELAKQDPRFKKALDEELTDKGIIT